MSGMVPAAKRISRSHKRKRIWQRFVRCLAMIVVFCTTYALILPAITMQSDHICGLQSHVHTDGCYEQRPVLALSCTFSDDTSHQHDPSCWVETGETEAILTCSLPEHTHTDACYPLEEEPTLAVEFVCGYGEHTHGEGCFDENGRICTLTEHTHRAECAVDRVDLTADLESADDWTQMVSGLSLIGDWAQDLLTLARSQIGYRESEMNCVLADGVLRGYTRYGDWYGNAYREWDDLFVAFCLHYAGIGDEIIPRDSDTDRWMEKLEQLGLLADPGEALPKAGDVVFCTGADGQLRAAIVDGFESANSDLDGLRYRVITGDVKDQVDTQIVSLDAITAVCDLTLIQAGGGSVTVDIPQTEPETPEIRCYTAETENYIVTVSCSWEQTMPQDVELRVTEYAKDSEIYLQRCQEAGYELEWLLNIGFFLGDTELDLDGDFNVVVTSKDGTAMGQDITHFSDSGAERIDGSGGEEDSVSFPSDGFSDFGGGVAPIADDATGYQFTTVNPGRLEANVDYAIYCVNGNNVTFLNSSLSAITNQGNSGTTSIGGTWTKTRAQMGNNNASAFTWRVVWQSGRMYLVCQANQQRLTIHNGWLQLTNEGTALNNTINGAGAYVGGQYKLRYDDQWRGTWTNDQGTYSTTPTTVYFARVTEQRPNYPHAVHTGEVNISRLRFYNLSENGDNGVSALAGCVFEITGNNGYKTTVVSGNDPEVNLPGDIPDGSYTIRELSAPDGYIRDFEHTRTFTVKNGALVSDRTIGTFINHNMEQLVADKTAQVADYANRIYQVGISADSHLRIYEMEPIDLLFVVDQSNSMLFPSGLESTGKNLTLRLDGNNNVNNIEALGLDKTKMHYIIADPTGTSTVWCVWHDGTAWLCQDASYYAKAKHQNEPGYQDPNETVIFPSNRSYKDQAEAEPDGVRSNGGGLGYNLAGSSLGKDIDAAYNDTKTYTVYTATDEFNRLHYMEEALTNLVYQLADVNDQNRVTLTRFTKEVKSEDCFGPVVLTPDNTEELVDQITHIKTSGGTRQDIALKHVYEEHLNNWGDHYSDADHAYTLLITDGAPVLSSNGGIDNLGGPNDAPTTTGNTVYGQIKGYAREVRGKSTLMTVGLGMESVEAGKSVLQQIATNNNYYCALDDASELIEFVNKVLFDSFRPKDEIVMSGDIVDEISDSFYPIAWVNAGRGSDTGRRVLTSGGGKDWVQLQENDWITLDGKFTTAGAYDAAGQLLRNDDGTFCIRWLSQNVTYGWNGTFYVKAKEDFIGGNAIDTNKSANVTVYESVKEFETPTVNVRLLDMNEMNSEVTLFLGDTVNAPGDSPWDSLKYFYENTRFSKILSGDGDVLNKAAIDGVNGLEEAVFYLRYAMGRDLTEEEFQRLLNGDTVELEYTYDDDSSHGAVGKFLFRLEKTGLGSAYTEHTSVTACQPGGHPLTENCTDPAETYTLHITYQAYRLNENGRPPGNVHNKGSGPGREVGTGWSLETGAGTIEKHNIHEVHVISGKIEIYKRFAPGVTDENDRTFYFTLHRVEDGEDTSRDVTKGITIPANTGQTGAFILFDNLPRGTYTVTEAADEDYAVKSLTVRHNTNCYTEPPVGGTGTNFVCTIGNNTADQNVIGYGDPADRYTRYIDPVNGVYAAAEFTNAPIVYTAELPVEKIWNDSTGAYAEDAVYVVLCLDGVPVLDTDGRARILRLDGASDWKGIFIVALADADDALSNYNYSIREVTQVREDNPLSWPGAILENDGTTVLYYEKTVEAGGLLVLGSKSYLVTYAPAGDGTLTVTNARALELPMTGGVGTHLYTFSGILLIAVALMFGCSQRRKKERRASG